MSSTSPVMDNKASCVSVGGGGAEPSTDPDLPPVDCLGDCWIGGVGGGKGVTLPGFGGLAIGSMASPLSDSDEEIFDMYFLIHKHP